jgi:hypothetical protein
VQGAAAGAYTVSIAAQGLATAPAGGNEKSASASLTVTAPAPSGGGGAIDGWDLMLAAGIVLIIRAPAGRKQNGKRSSPRPRR